MFAHSIVRLGIQDSLGQKCVNFAEHVIVEAGLMASAAAYNAVGLSLLASSAQYQCNSSILDGTGKPFLPNHVCVSVLDPGFENRTVSSLLLHPYPARCHAPSSAVSTTAVRLMEAVITLHWNRSRAPLSPQLAMWFLLGLLVGLFGGFPCN